MRLLERKIIAARAALRRAGARLGRTDPRAVRPERLVLRLDDADLPGSLGEGRPLSLADWRRCVADATLWRGPAPVTVLAGRRAGSLEAAEIVRFAHRLSCPTALVSDGTGLEEAALALLDAGLGAARVLVGGVTEPVHRGAVGSPLAAAAGGVQALLDARRRRRQPLDVEIVLPWQGSANREALAVLAWARQLGCDGFRVLPPWRAADAAADPEVLDALAAVPPPFHRTPRAAIGQLHAMAAAGGDGLGLSRRRWRCPVGGQRLELSANGRLYSCPFHESIPREGGLQASWEQAAGPHLRAIAACERACAHVELAPAPLLRR